ncbi:ParB N-terminal domain-containing protein [Nocardia beijingensis]|uniref:ParB N-terminal domain-containing protein n=1 Tax=Nocardia beijingensis TaxID=95162 RepID=UPI001893AB45|nr:ParB N-terminal domain-containing protein [Nocardia beijingensis]MBF6079657.1 ParB N-terminal domain-containing protein [Nocardia beijingensis]
MVIRGTKMHADSINDKAVEPHVGDWGGYEIVELQIAEIRAVDSPRIGGLNVEHVDRLVNSTTTLPPIVVHRSTMQVIDGLHRLRARMLCGDSTISAVLFDGDPDEAFVLSVRLNTLHGLPLSTAERKAAARRIIGAHPEWSDRSIAAVAGLSDKTVATVRKRMTAELPQSSTRLARNGVQHPADSASGRLRAAELFTSTPDISSRTAALEAGISVTTAKDVRNRLRRGDDPLPARQRDAHDQANGGSSIDGDSSIAKAPDLQGIGDASQVAMLLQRLRADPSLRFSESGRMLLRGFEILTANPAKQDAIARSLPTHCAPFVAELAHQCSNGWQRFATLVDQRIADAS